MGQVSQAANGDVDNEFLAGGLVIEPLGGHAGWAKEEQPDVANETNREAEQNGRIPIWKRWVPPDGYGEDENSQRQAEEGAVDKVDVGIQKNIRRGEGDANEGDAGPDANQRAQPAEPFQRAIGGKKAGEGQEKKDQPQPGAGEREQKEGGGNGVGVATGRGPHAQIAKKVLEEAVAICRGVGPGAAGVKEHAQDG